LLLGQTMIGWRVYVMRTIDWIETRRRELDPKRVGCMSFAAVSP
jgi:hypothetical protein